MCLQNLVDIVLAKK